MNFELTHPYRQNNVNKIQFEIIPPFRRAVKGAEGDELAGIVTCPQNVRRIRSNFCKLSYPVSQNELGRHPTREGCSQVKGGGGGGCLPTLTL